MLLPRQALGELQLLVSNSLLGAFCFVQFARSILWCVNIENGEEFSDVTGHYFNNFT